MTAMLVWFLVVVSAGVGTNGFSPSFSDATRGTPRPHEHGVQRASAVELGCARLARLGSRADWSRLSHAALLAALDDLFDGLCVDVHSARTSTTHAGEAIASLRTAAAATGKLPLRREAGGLGVRNVMGEDTLGGFSSAESKTKLRALHYIDQSAHARARAWLDPDPRRARARVRARARARGPKAGLQLDESADQHRPDQGQPSSPQLVPDRYPGPSHGHGPAHVTEPTPVRVTSTPGRLELAVDDWPGEREALEAVFNSTGGQTWAQNDHWTSANVSVCAWFGVKCTSGRVSALNLTGNGLVGEVPLFTLDRLVVLNLSGNALTGIAADALASLPLLQSL